MYRRRVPQVPADELRDRLAQRIREVAKRKGITLTELANRAGVSQAGFWLAMGGKSSPSLDVDPRRSDQALPKPKSPPT